MIRTIDELPGFKVGDLVKGKKSDYVITNIISIMVEDPIDQDMGPTISFKVLMMEITDKEEN